MTKLYFTRHGQTEWNLEGRLQGHMNSPLTEIGVEQAKQLGMKLNDHPLDIIASSSSERASHTAQLIRGNRNIEIIETDELREMNFGVWQGELKKDINEKYPEQYYNFWNAPHLYETIEGESFESFHKRISNAIEEIINTHKNKSILVVAHGVVLKSIYAYFENKEIKDLWKGVEMHSTSLNLIEIKNNEIEFIIKGDTSHYDIELVSQI